MTLTNQDVVDIVAWRHKLHSMPEISGEEHTTAAEVEAFLATTNPDHVITDLGGTGVAVIYEGEALGPSVLFRAELDALPIEEIGSAKHKSAVQGKGHMCGHDGHMSILAALGRQLGRDRPKRGRAILLFQPAEETGAGAAAVIADEKFQSLRPDYSFSLHNMPGIPFGRVWLKPGIVNCASQGLLIRLKGATAHASMPETGTSPAPAIAHLIPGLTGLAKGKVDDADFALATVTHVKIGEPAFGIAPGDAELWVTLRTRTDDAMATLFAAATNMVRDVAARYGLKYEFEQHDVFAHCENDAEATVILTAALDAEGVHHEAGETFRGSEDFGRFGSVSRSAMFYLGAGENTPALHNANYDFPDDLMPIGAKVFLRAARMLLD